MFAQIRALKLIGALSSKAGSKIHKNLIKILRFKDFRQIKMNLWIF